MIMIKNDFQIKILENLFIHINIVSMNHPTCFL